MIPYICSGCGEVESFNAGICPLCKAAFKRQEVTSTKEYIISEKRLLELLEAEATLQCLESDGVEDWEWYMEGRERFIADALCISESEVRERDLDFIDVAKTELCDFQSFN